MCVHVACYHHYTISFNKLTYIYVVRNLLIQAQDRKIGSAISNDLFGLNNQKFSKMKKGH